MIKSQVSKKIVLLLDIIMFIITVLIVYLVYYSDYKRELVDFEVVRKEIEGDNYGSNLKATLSTVNLIIDSYEDETTLTDEEKYLRYLKAKPTFRKVDKREKKDTFCFVGEVFFSTNIRRTYDDGGIEAVLDESFRKIFESSDMNIANLECCITDNTDNADDKTFTFALPKRYAKGLKELNVDLFTLANNHILDYGMEGLGSTIEVLDSIDIAHIGAGNTYNDAKKVYIKEIDGKRYAFLAASAVLPSGKWQANESHGGVYNGYEIDRLDSEIRLIKPYFDKVIVYMHWGNELETESNIVQRNAAHKLVDAGADLVIGTHAHTTQEIEYYNNVPIVYSIGNFIYGGQSRDMFVVEATFDYQDDVDGTLRLKVYPGISGFRSTRTYENVYELKSKFINLDKKSSTCIIDDDGFVMH